MLGLPTEARALLTITRAGLVGPERPDRLLASVQAVQRYGAMGGAIFNLAAGQLLTYGAGYGTLFAVVGSLHAVAFAILLLTSGVLHPPATNKFQEREKLVSS